MHCILGDNFTQFCNVSKSNCEGKDYADGLWAAQWETAVFHIDPFGHLTQKPIVSSGVLSERNSQTCMWISRPVWRLFLSRDSPVMAIPISALVHWYVNLTHHSYSSSWLKSEILGLWGRELGRRVGRLGVPGDFLQPGEGRCELSTLNKMARPWKKTSFTRMWWTRYISISYIAMMILTRAPRSWWATPYLLYIFLQIDIDIVCHIDLWWWKLGGRVGRQHLAPEPLSSLECRAQ